MTSRLKRKLNDLGVDPSSAKANESFCLIGTPLPPLEKSKDTGEFVPLWKQEVRDEKGRKRLHGAFTGGFSAGYFNTVGSKEGWAPSTFVSSRSGRAKAKVARPEDFMDEEDLAELREGRKLVDESEEMDFGGTEAELQRRAGADVDKELENEPITAVLEASLAPAPKDSVGARILKKMGWRLGQGIGPRLTYAQRKAQDAGRYDAVGEMAGDEEDEEAAKHLYPRRDTPVLLASRKGNFHGLGYVPGMRLEEHIGTGRGDERERGPRIATGFGLGALNEADEDDLDVYDSGIARHRHSHLAFDAADEDNGRPVTMGGSSARQSTHAHENRVTTGVFAQTFNDGRPVLKGFVLSDRPVSEDRWFPLPEVPRGWTPNPHRVWEQDTNKENIKHEISSHVAPGKPQTHTQWKESFISADQRGSILGEMPLPSEPRSIFEYMSQKDRERLQNIKNAISGPSSTAPSPAAPPPTQHVPGEIDIPYIHPSVAKAALQGFQPFITDPVKQSRYTAFLYFQASRGSVVPGAPNETGIGIGPTPGQSIEELNKELDDYAKAAAVFKPLSGAMADRFRSAVVVEMGPAIVEGLRHPTHSNLEEEQQPEVEEEKKEEDPKMGAVRLGMYGPLTREVQPWQPARLLCKRFAVKDPEVDMSGAEGTGNADFTPTAAVKQGTQADAAMSEASVITSGLVSAGAITDGSSGGAQKKGTVDLANVGLGEDDDQGRDTLTYQRPAMDVFKAIFASDEEDSEDEVASENPEKAYNKVDLDETSAPQPGVQVEAEMVPSHLTAGDSTTASYVLAKEGAAATSTLPEKVDLASFKPTFVPRSERESRKDKSKDKDKKEKDKKKKSANKATLMSFDVEEDGFGLNLGAVRREKDKDKERKKKKLKEHKEKEEDDSMWVEKPLPEAVKSIVMDISPPDVPARASAEPSPVVTAEGEVKGPRGRKRAIDFM
ncbi:uncharacterized protein LAESUDRAFT_764494 [Laetiporus sulphureus 93-53]|uniref:G-patch domain-containing protein n=1 Tax=Laetiporus sulphureus 93-53 TaxID=1314785 RepID=A0A165B9U3_9APHY|nr:uncharacterized protein LAESUDRAFT_764494 [Laetiporus sulphureus 93-53]KZT00580.1 hypothetical protein LAESUDRAFT_764494 [Laetiporus sulphureus 93-53]